MDDGLVDRFALHLFERPAHRRHLADDGMEQVLILIDVHHVGERVEIDVGIGLELDVLPVGLTTELLEAAAEIEHPGPSHR